MNKMNYKKRLTRLQEALRFIKGHEYNIKVTEDTVQYKWYEYKGKKLNKLIFTKKNNDISLNESDIETAFDQDIRQWVKK